MIKYILKRILQMIPVMLGISILVFILMSITPGDPARMILGNMASNEDVAMLREQLGLNDSYVVQYLKYMKGIITEFNLGTSYRSGMPVTFEIADRISITLTLSGLSLLFAAVVGVSLGVISAVKQYSVADYICTFFSLFGVSAPSFWIGLILVLIFSVNLGWLPSSGSYGVEYWILPIIVLGLQSTATIMRMTRSSMLEVVRQDYIRTARAKGQTERKVVIHHALRNSFITVITVIGNQACTLLAGASLVETIFSMPGIGKYLIDHIAMKDTPAVMGTILFIGFGCAILNLITDIAYGLLDPRLKSENAGKRKTKKFLSTGEAKTA
jgi:peptide/nickel transport system permease protein